MNMRYHVLLLACPYHSGELSALISVYSSLTCKYLLRSDCYNNDLFGNLLRVQPPGRPGRTRFIVTFCEYPITFVSLDAFPGDRTYTVASLTPTDRLPELNQRGRRNCFLCASCFTTDHRPRRADLAGRALSEIDGPDHPSGRRLALSSPGHNMGSAQL